jgi:5-oxopent-3-ene-1,2,5-tricarboxylate decarboxylase/2-hydroxyhepta-2,4-diene-1,7-dioate isomerase
MTLESDDVILTGTPCGISHVYPGDVMRLEIDGIGALENPVVAEDQAL